MPRRRKDRVDSNQAEIVKDLRKLGYSVIPGHDDILVGKNGRTYWFELKENSKSKLQPSQEELLEEYQGHYKIVWSLDMILEDIKNN